MTKIRIIDDLNPEDNAMLQALYSRSAESVDTHLEKVEKVGSGKFMQNFYVGYGHKSIADCGSTTAFIEDVSLLAAKAVQNNPLYCGQETSTRYIDMASRHIVDPIGTPASKRILDKWMAFYKNNQQRVCETLRDRYPMGESFQDNALYDKTIKARAFDVLRGFLPAGITTQLSWHTNLRQAGDHLTNLVGHPSSEIRDLAEDLVANLSERYPSSGFGLAVGSGSGSLQQGERAAWNRMVAKKYGHPAHNRDASFDSTILNGSLAEYREIFETRPKGCVLPHFLTDLGQLHFNFLLDFGSFRDIQRHRNGVCRMPLLTTNFGFEQWYIEQLDTHLRQDALQLIAEQEAAIAEVTYSEVYRQYYTALGFRVPTSVTYGLPAAVYVMELRSSRSVHPTLRKKTQEMILAFKEQHPMVKLYVDEHPSDWDINRGAQTITEKT